MCLAKHPLSLLNRHQSVDEKNEELRRMTKDNHNIVSME